MFAAKNTEDMSRFFLFSGALVDKRIMCAYGAGKNAQIRNATDKFIGNGVINISAESLYLGKRYGLLIPVNSSLN